MAEFRRRRHRVPLLLSRIFVQIFGSAGPDLLFRIRSGRRNHIGATRPFTQIDGAAAVAAEREFSIIALDGFLADRASELERAFARHVSGYSQVLTSRTRLSNKL